MVYAFHAALEVLARTGKEPVMIIPSGNVGNSCGSFWAKVVGAPIDRIVLALNANRPILDYLESGEYRKRPSIPTLANAMDVGDPSNMERLTHLFGSYRIQRRGECMSGDDIRSAQHQRAWEEHGYLVCPHTATGEHVRRLLAPKEPTVVYATAHPAKFDTVVEPVVGCEVPIPPQLADLLHKKRTFTIIDADHRLLFS
jgi:threonine synthase